VAILKASSCYVSEAAQELPELGGSITAREEKILNVTVHGLQRH
ncbi:unnamed protein product, partial [marine sediment metagenome]